MRRLFAELRDGDTNKQEGIMNNKAFQRVYTHLDAVTKATVTVRAQGASNDELAMVGDRLAQVVKIEGDKVTLQVFSGTEGLATNVEVAFTGHVPGLKVGEDLAGRFFDAYGRPIDGGAEAEGEWREIGGPSVNPLKRKQPSQLIPTGIAGIDLNNTLVSGQKIPFFADPDQPYNEVMCMVALRAKVDKIILGGMGLTNDDYLYFKKSFENAGALDKIICFVNTTEDPAVERLLVPDMALTAALRSRQERKGIGAVDRHDPVCRCLEYRQQPYGPDPVERQHARFVVLGLGQDLREGRRAAFGRLHHDSGRDHLERRGYHPCRA